jgi:aminopeptidase
VEGFETMTKEELDDLGVNDSQVHVDFMIGTPDMSIVGWKDGKATPIFENGNWAL